MKITLIITAIFCGMMAIFHFINIFYASIPFINFVFGLIYVYLFKTNIKNIKRLIAIEKRMKDLEN